MSGILATPLGPSLVMSGVAFILLALARRVRSSPLSHFLAFMTALLALLLVINLRSAPRGSVVAWSWQPPIGPANTFSWQTDGWSWAIAMLVMILGSIDLLLLDWDDGNQTRGFAARLWLMSAALLFVFSGNLFTLAAVWWLADATLLTVAQSERPGSATRVVAMNALGGLALWLALWNSDLGQLPAGTEWIAEASRRIAGLGLPFAALIRTGIYPLHLGLPRPTERQPYEASLWSLMMPLVGLWLLGSVLPFSHAGQTLAVVVGTLALLGSALAAWASADNNRRSHFLAINRASLAALLAFARGGQATTLLWPAMILGLGIAIWIIAQQIFRRTGWQLPLWLAIAALLGIPFTLGWQVNLTFAATFAPGSAGIFWFGMILAQALFVATVVQQAVPLFRERSSQTWLALGQVNKLLTAALILFVLALAYGIRPGALAALVLPGQESALFPMFPSLSVVAWLGMILPLGAGIAIGLVGNQRIFLGLQGWQERLERIASLEWGRQTLRWLVFNIGDNVRSIMLLLEGEGYLGWLLLAAAVILLIVARPVIGNTSFSEMRRGV